MTYLQLSLRYLLATISIIILSFALFFIIKEVLAWTNPSQAPPGGNGSGVIPSGQIAFFNLSSCPSGWTEATSTRGRYVVGLPSGGSLASTAGTALSNLENRPTGAHTHNMQSAGNPGYSGGTPVPFSAALNQIYGAIESGGVAGGAIAGTNAPYIQFLVCQKD